MVVYEKVKTSSSLPLYKKIVTQDIEPKECLVNIVLLVPCLEGHYELQFDKMSLLTKHPEIRT